MSKISEYLKQILSARYGKDVRQAIHDSIYEINEIANGAQDSATSAADNAIKKANEAFLSAQSAAQKAQEALDSAEVAEGYAKQAETFSGIHIASNEIAGVIKPGENTVDEDGTLVMLRKVSGNNLVLNDSYKGSLRINKTFGKSTQDGVPTPEAPVPIVNAGQKLAEGWQLANLPDKEATTYNGVTWSCKNGAVTAKGTTEFANNSDGVGISYLMPVIAGTYTLSGGGTILKLHALVTLADGTNKYYGSVTFNLDGTEKSCLIFCQVNAGATANETIYPMLNVGTTAKPWEPYTGGVKAAYDIPIEAEVMGGNLINLPDTSEIVILGITWSCKNGIVSAKGTATGTSNSSTGGLCYDMPIYAGTYVLSGKPLSINVLIKITKADGAIVYRSRGEVFTLDGTEKQCRAFCQVSSGVTINDSTYLMVNAGTTAIPFEVYKPHQSLTINTPNGLPGIPVTDASLANYTDENGQMWCCDTREWERGVDVKRVGVEVFNGSEVWGVGEQNVEGYNGVFYHGDNSIATGNVGAISNRYIFGSNVAYSGYVGQFDLWHKQFRFNCGSFTTVDEWKAQLAEWNNNGSPLTVQYILATPIETPIPEEEMAAWRAMHSNEPTTTILSDADVEVEYPTSRVGAVALDADMRSRENEKKSGVIFIGDYTTETAVDFDNLIEDGNYDFNAAYITNAVNAPIVEAGTLQVRAGKTTGYITQMYQSRYGNVIVRFYNNAAWAPWEKLAKAKDFLPLTGGTLSGSLFIDNGYTKVDGGTGGSSLVSYSEPKGASFRTITIKDNAELGDSASIYNQKNDGTSRAYNIFGEHNKPSGSYTGNGSAASRTIDTGGLSKAVLITGSGSALLTPAGAYKLSGGTISSLGTSACRFNNGVLTLTTTDTTLNTNGTTYYYQVL